MTPARIHLACVVVCLLAAAGNAPFALDGHVWNVLSFGWCMGIAWSHGLFVWFVRRTT